MKKNKYLYIIIFIIFSLLLYTHFNTFLANDDLPYMYFHRTDVRVNSFLDVIKNQYTDYFNINGRIFVHTIVQLVLIFDKNLWSIINPIMIISGIILIIKIIKLENKDINKILSLLLGISLYLTLFKYKRIIYWVAGSVNYIWVFTFLILILYLYYKHGFHKKTYTNIIIIFILCMIHECTMVFTIIFIIGNIIIDWYKNKKINKTYLLYTIGFLGSLILLLSPANQTRLISNETWNQLNLIEKILTSIPVISKNILNLTNSQALLSYTFIISIIILLIKNKNKFSKINIILIITNIIIIYILKNNWLYFSLLLLLIIGENYTYIKNKEYHLSVLNISIYSVIYFNMILPTYSTGRPNYYFYMYIIFLALKILNKYLLKNNYLKKACYIIIPILSIVLLSNEVYVYSQIGNYHKQRLKIIEEYNKLESKETLYLPKIEEKYYNYHMDINLPDKTWFTYDKFINYYNLPENIDIIYIEGVK